MSTSLVCFALLNAQASALNWNPKEIELPADLHRIQFQVYVPSQASTLIIQKAKLVWVPQLAEWPGRPGRQALRLSMKDRDGKVLELFLVPAIADGCAANIGQVVGQGYLSFSLKPGMSIVTVEKEGTCIGLISSDYGTAALHDLAKGLQPMRQPRQAAK